MDTEKLSISRKMALKRLGGMSLGLLFATSIVQNTLAQNTSVPAIKPLSNINNSEKEKNKPNILLGLIKYNANRTKKNG